MCLAVPGEVTEITEGPLRMGRVSFSGVIKEVCLEYVPEARLGSHVLVHAGFAIATVSESHAHDVLTLLARAEREP